MCSIQGQRSAELVKAVHPDEEEDLDAKSTDTSEQPCLIKVILNSCPVTAK